MLRPETLALTASLAKVVEHTLGQTRQPIATTCKKHMSHVDIA